MTRSAAQIFVDFPVFSCYTYHVFLCLSLDGRTPETVGTSPAFVKRVTHSDTFRFAAKMSRGLSEGERRLRAGLSPHGQVAADAPLTREGTGLPRHSRLITGSAMTGQNGRLTIIRKPPCPVDGYVLCRHGVLSELPSLLTDIKTTAF